MPRIERLLAGVRIQQNQTDPLPGIRLYLQTYQESAHTGKLFLPRVKSFYSFTYGGAMGIESFSARMKEF